MTTFGEILDLLDVNRESEEIVCIMDKNGKTEMRGMACSDLWKPHEQRIVKSIQADDYCELNVWLDDPEIAY